jgi:hypothetical protein
MMRASGADGADGFVYSGRQFRKVRFQMIAVLVPSRGIADALAGFINRSSLPSSGRPTDISRTE